MFQGGQGGCFGSLRLESLWLFPREQQEKVGPWVREVIQDPLGPLESRD